MFYIWLFATIEYEAWMDLRFVRQYDVHGMTIEVRETTYWWMIEYSEDRPHDSLGDNTPAEHMKTNAEKSNYELSTK